jgi:hypothetical protein
MLSKSEGAFAALPGSGVHTSNLLEGRMVVTTYNPHVRLSRNYAAGASMIWNPRLAALRLMGCFRSGRFANIKVRCGRSHGGIQPLRGQIPSANCADQSAPLPRRRPLPRPSCSFELTSEWSFACHRSRQKGAPMPTDTVMVVRCPNCIAGIEFRPMIAYKDGRFVCRDCAHTTLPGSAEYRCTCRMCLGWRRETMPGGVRSPIGSC